MIQPRTRSMTYDARDRVATTTYAYNGRTFNYTYDVLDNLRTTREAPGGRSHNHEYAADGRLTRIVDPAAPSTAVIGYTYDARGNATSRTSATGFVPNTTPIVVDEANRIRSATVGADTETYTYDGLGRRTHVTTSVGPLMQFYSQPGQPLLWEIPGNEVKTREYNIHLGPQRIARRMTSSLTYLHTDHLGSPLAETTQAPVTLVSSNPHWEPYGAPAAGAFWGGLQFAGHYQDRVTRLTYMQQRYYDPYAGRFLAVDPVAASPGNFNRYWYANNNPYKYIDPDGRLPSLKDHPSLRDGVRTYYVNTSTANASGSVTETRYAVTNRGIANEGNVEPAGKIERLPQRSANGTPATVGDKIKERLFNFSNKEGKTIGVTSGQRTTEQNQAVRGARNSQHLLDNAADIRIVDYTKKETADAAHASGEFNRVNEYPDSRGVHVDLKEGGTQGRFYDWRPQE